MFRELLRQCAVGDASERGASCNAPHSSTHPRFLEDLARARLFNKRSNVSAMRCSCVQPPGPGRPARHRALLATIPWQPPADVCSVSLNVASCSGEALSSSGHFSQLKIMLRNSGSLFQLGASVGWRVEFPRATSVIPSSNNPFHFSSWNMSNQRPSSDFHASVSNWFPEWQ